MGRKESVAKKGEENTIYMQNVVKRVNEKQQEEDIGRHEERVAETGSNIKEGETEG